ncbi:MAG: hypothetical protein QXW73_01200 [Nitrososphaerales archaeon]
MRMKLLFSFALAVLIGMNVNVNQMLPNAYAHGLGTEQTLPMNVGDRIAFLRVSIAPELKKFNELKDITLTIEMVDALSGRNIRGAGYHITVEKFANGIVLLEETFHAAKDNEKLVVRFKTTEGGDVFVRGQKVDDTLGYVATDTLSVEGPVFMEAGLYRFAMEVVVMDGQIVPIGKRAIFEAFITLAESRTFAVTYNAKQYALETISYFDNIVDFEFEPSSMSIKMIMQLEQKFCRKCSVITC